ncbi:MAG: hypothetical protein JNM24_04325 [Bdellovibrionaceae bacterium]|nr:hypothetical protein [Pseudobdellovibrionaceae bacterium]
MIEYILLLVITISMILLAMANLFKPMQNFLQNFMGTYVACLLTSGELPAIRTENTMRDQDPKCSFSMTGGNGTPGSGGPGSGGNNNPNGNGNNGNNGNGSNGNNANGGDGTSGSGSGDGSNVNGGNGNGGAGSYAGSRSRRSGIGKSAFLRRSSDGGAGSSDDGSAGGTRYVNNLDRNKDDRFFRNRQKTTQLSNRNGRGVFLTGLTEEEQKKIERKIQSEPRTLPKSSEEFSVPGKKSIVKPPPEKKKFTSEEKEESFTIGSFFKYILIAVILLLILILGGGQAFEMSKTME